MSISVTIVADDPGGGRITTTQSVEIARMRFVSHSAVGLASADQGMVVKVPQKLVDALALQLGRDKAGWHALHNLVIRIEQLRYELLLLTGIRI